MEPSRTTSGQAPLPPPAGAAPVATRPPVEVPFTPPEVTSRGVVAVKQLPMLPLRFAGVGGLILSLALAGWQIGRVLAGDERLSVLAWGALFAAVVGVLGVLAWTWVVVENARRLLEPARNQEPPDPHALVVSWIPALVVATGAVFAVTMLQYRLVRPEDDTSSALPLAVAAGAMLVTLLVAQRPLALLSSIMRRLGGPSIDLMRLVWVPLTLAVVGAASLVAMRAGGVFGDDFDGIAPAWALGVVMIVPVLVAIGAAWNGAIVCESTVEFAFDRRNGVAKTGVGRRQLSWFTRLLRADGSKIVRDRTKPIELVPGSSALRLAMFIGLAAMTLIAIVAALVMTLFWRESNRGPLLPTQVSNAWDVLSSLQDLQRLVALGLLAVVTLWAFLEVLNVRLASGRRRNPLLAAASWPVAAFAIWRIADRTADGTDVEQVVGFAAQVAIAYLPFFLLERAAIAVRVHRRPLRLTYGLLAVLIVQTQSLTGLSTLDTTNVTEDYGRVAGYLAIAAALHLLAVLSISESSRLLHDGAVDDAADHNALVASRVPSTDAVAGGDDDTETDATPSASAAVMSAPVAGGVAVAASEPPSSPGPS